MQKRSLIRVTFSLILALALFITTVIISPRVASAQNTPKTPLEALEQGIQFDEQGDLVNAESSYQKAIDLVLASQYVDIFIGTKQHLADIKESQGKTEEANTLNEEAEAGINLLGTDIIVLDSRCCSCDRCGENKEEGGIGGQYCMQCSPD